MQDMLMVASENERLRRCMNDILSITALPAVWTGGTVDEIGALLLDALRAILDVDFLFLRVAGQADQPEVLMERSGEGSARGRSKLIDDLIATLGTNVSDWPREADLEQGESSFRIVTEKLGVHGKTGVLVAGSMVRSFPSEEERIVLHVAASQATIAVAEVMRFRDDTRAIAARELNKVVDAIPVMAWSTLPDGWADFFNEHFLTYLGITTEQAAGWGWTTALHPDDSGPLQSVWAGLLASGAPGETEARLRRWDGQYRWFLFRANPVFGEAGKVIRWYGTNTDIDDRKRFEEEMRRSAALMTQAQRLTVTGSVWWKPATGEIYWSDEAYRVAGHDLGTTPTVDMMLDRCHPDDLPTVRKLISNAMRHGENVDIEHRLVMRDGAIKYVHVVLQNIAADPADPEFIGAVADITQRKISEEKLRRSDVLLTEGQRISRTGTFSWKVETDEIAFSEELNRIFGFESGRVVDFDGIGQRVFEEDLPLLATKMADVREGGDNPDYEIRLLVDGQLKYVRVVGRIIKHLNGTTECIGAVQDVSAQRVAELARDKLRSELAQLARTMSLSTMAASIAHEVNQPLSGIIMNSSALLRMLSTSPPNVDGGIETAKRTIRDGNRASDVIMRLRKLFKRGVATVEQFDLHDAAREVIGLVANDLQRGRITLVEELSGAPSLIVGDRVQLQQVMMNLLRNSIDAMADVAQQQRKIVVRIGFGHHEVTVIVEDSGIGLENADIERLFDAFHTTKPNGMGIGLSVSRSIVEAHKGRIWAEPSPSGGAAFGFALPVGRRAEGDFPLSEANS
ncbi:histidine kinase [Rhizobium sp. R72]|uniref:PAS domain-containing sensor histidine kinase n=1 Tax=unclassified Rhizobium TaxID=2613769 RepID=UPI000B52F595|nr:MULTISPECIES: PAS domain-containing protein [unclassified Rhizobium]OWV98916.1 histidine kinase [Rhizobium sp. R72]OWV98967.1 histidine kinase [Rhizobium sp. R711]